MPVNPDAALSFIGNLRNTKGKFFDQPFQVYDFQEELIRTLCSLNRHGRRRMKEFLLGVARKNGKTELIAALALVFLVLDGEAGGEVVIAAGKKDQARILFNAAKKMVLLSSIGGRPLTDFLDVRQNEIYFPELDARLYPVSADAQNEQGLNPHVAIVDELHVAAQKDRDLYDALQTAMDARENPLLLSLTTAGPIPAGPCHDLYKYGLECNTGLRVDPDFGMKWYEAEPGCDLEDPRQWLLANPALGKFLFRENFEAAVRAVKSGRSSEYAFRRLRLNNWTTATERWLPWRKWEAGGGVPIIPDGAPIYVGVDAALSRDTFGIAWVYVEPDAITVEHETETGLLVPRSVSVAHLRVKKFATERDGEYIDPADVEMFLLGLAQKYAIMEVAYDPAYMGLLAAALSDRGLPMEAYAQSPEKMTAATETLQRLVLDGRLRHGNDPVLNAEMGGVGVAPTERGVRISKRKSGLKIDCAVASAMALQIAVGEEDEPVDFAFIG